jgi:hypothetical protein
MSEGDWVTSASCIRATIKFGSEDLDRHNAQSLRPVPALPGVGPLIEGCFPGY